MSTASIYAALLGFVSATTAFGQTTWNGVDCGNPARSAAAIQRESSVDYVARISLTDQAPNLTTVERLSGSMESEFFEFGTVASNGSSTRTFLLANDSDQELLLSNAVLYGGGASGYSVHFRGAPMPMTLAPGASADLDVTFQPQSMGASPAQLSVIHSLVPSGHMGPTVNLFAVGLGEQGSELLINAGGTPRMDSKWQMWTSDLGAQRGRTFRLPKPLTETRDDELFQTMRVGKFVKYAIEIPDGDYEVTLDVAQAPTGSSVIVLHEGEISEVDTGALSGEGVPTGSVKLAATISDGALNIGVVSSTPGTIVGIAGIQIRTGFKAPLPTQPAKLQATPRPLDFGFVTPGNTVSMALELENTSSTLLNLTDLAFIVGDAGGTGSEMNIDLGGVNYVGLSDDAAVPATLILRPGQSATASVNFVPTILQLNELTLRFRGNFKPVFVPIVANGGVDTEPFLHVVIEDTGPIVDFDLDGMEMVTLEGTFSHTHYPGAELSSLTWFDGDTQIGTGPIITVPMTTGTHEICLVIVDDTVPAASLTGCETIRVASPSNIPGVLALYNEPGGMTLQQLIVSNLDSPSYVETRTTLKIFDDGGIGGSPFDSNIVVQQLAKFSVPSDGGYQFDSIGSSFYLIKVDDLVVNGPGQVMQLSAGRHDIEVRTSVVDLGQLPFNIRIAPAGGSFTPIAAEDLHHDQTALEPVINSLPVDGAAAGGDVIMLTGLGFFPSDQVTVNFGGTILDDNDFISIDPYSISFISPGGLAGSINVTVQSPQGTSSPKSFLYKSDFTPVDFTALSTTATMNLPTCGDWGPDGRFYVLNRFGQLKIFTFDEDYNVTATQSANGVASLTNKHALGIAFNPYDAPSPVKVYVAHSKLFAQGGGSFQGPSPYTGQVSVLTGPNFNTPVPLITNLPTSNHDHAVNGMQFDHNGDLLITIGGNTNAGVAAPLIGDVPESPLSGAIIKAETSKPGFNGAITYVETIGGLPNNDQVFGEEVDIAAGVDVSVQAHGVRNAFDIVYTLEGRLYSTSNGPNDGYGPTSTSATTEGNDPTEPDRFDLIEYDNYYGHASRSRGRTDDRQNVFRTITTPSIPGEYVAPLEVLSSSTNGITEYRANTFGGKMRGEILAQRWNGLVRRIALADDGRSVTASSGLAGLTALDVQVGPGGVILGVDYSGSDIDILVPNDSGATGLTVYDIFPNRAVSTGGQSFVIGGENFGTIGNTTVTIGGLAATLSSVTSRRIHGTIPVQPSPTTDLLDVIVTVSGSPEPLTEGFRYLFPTAGNEPGRWEDSDSLPAALGEVAAGVIDGVIYAFGEGSVLTYDYNIATKTWGSSLPIRAHAGHHQAAEVVDGKLYLIGGLGAGSSGKVQIFDPVLETWTLGANMPWTGGSASSSVIDGKIYVAGGIVGVATVADCAVYDPVLDSWTSLAPMPLGRNHAAGGTDGSRFFVFGGRDGGNTVGNGFDDVQIYDPILDSWIWDKDGVSGLAPLPQARGGTGRSIFYRGEFYVMGGETDNGGGATANDVYDRVDVYDPVANTWRLDAPMPTPRHGIYPVLFQSRFFLPAGGTVAAFSSSDIMDVYTRQ